MTYHIMLVEDNLSDIELVKTAFEEVGIVAHYTIFRDGDEAIQGIRQLITTGTLPELVLLDLNLPRTSGHEVLGVLRQQSAFTAIPVVVFSTSNHPADRISCLASGANDYQVKPPHFDDLITFVERLRDRWLARAP